MAAQETGKQRAARIPLNYYKRMTRLEWWKECLSAIALLAAAGWAAWSFLSGDDGNLPYSRGPVASVHQSWNVKCAACHESFVPIQGEDHWAARLIPCWFKTTRKEHQCTACHAGPVHHANEMKTADCVACHREHRDASLVRLPDRDCTQCHADLASSVKSGAELTTPKDMHHIRGFSTAQGHGDFQNLMSKADKQKLKFSHDRHLSAGMNTPARGDANFTLGKLAGADRKRIEDQQAEKGDAARVQLQCASCHQLDSGDRAGKNSERSGGAYLLPINYEAHCQACHPLTIERVQDEKRNTSQISVPHGLQPQEIRRYLEGLYTDKVLKNDLKAFEAFVGKRQLPGKTLDEKPVRNFYDAIVKAEKNLFYGNKTCGECHHYDPADALNKRQIDASEPPLFRIAPTQVPQVWFEHALFNHAAHRAVDCRECHEKGLGDGGKTSVAISNSHEATDVFIPRMDTCVKCHAPQSTSKGNVVSGGARHDCTECHRYHNGDHALQGLGAAKRDPRGRRAIDAFLNPTKQGAK